MKMLSGFSLGQLIHATAQPYETRQTAHSRDLRDRGVCWCGEPTNGKSLCSAHLKDQRDRMRARRRGSR